MGSACSFFTQIEAQVGQHGALWRKQLASDDAANLHYQLHNPSSDHCASYYGVAKELFGPECQVGQCGQHMSGKFFEKVSDYLRKVEKIWKN